MRKKPLNTRYNNKPHRQYRNLSAPQIQVREEAHRLLELGYTPIPAIPNEKRPVGLWKTFQSRPPTHKELDQLFDQNPAATGLGIITTELVIIDVDSQKDGTANPFPEDPEHIMDLSPAPAVDTPGGGIHFYFRASVDHPLRNSVGKLAPRVDVRAEGGFLIIPPTNRDDGHYEWRSGLPLDVPPNQLPDVPDFVFEMLAKTEPESGARSFPAEGPIPEGQRNDTLFRLASKWRGKGLSPREILELLRLHNVKRCNPPLEEEELKAIARSAGKYEPNELPEPISDHPDPGPIPDRLLEIPGFVFQVMELTLSTAPRPNKPLAFAGAVTLLGTLAGRKVCTESDLRTNIYMIGLGASGVGKDHPRKVNKAVMFRIGMHDTLLGSVASGQALEDEVQKQPSCLVLADEMDELMLAIRQDKSGTRQNLPKVLMELFTSASGHYQTRAKAGQERHHIDQPNLCLFGTAVPEHFYNSISARMMDDGFLGRTLLIEAGKLGPRQRGGRIDIPEGILHVARFWMNNEAQPGWNPKHPDPRVVTADDDGATILDQAADDFDEVRRLAQEKGDVSAVSIWARAWEHTAKLALIYAISEDHKVPIITREAALWAVEFIGHHTRRMIATVHGRVAEGEFHALLIKTKNKIENSPNQTMSRSRLMRNMHISARDLDQVMTVLIEGGEVGVINGDPQSPKQRGCYYRLVGE